MDGFSGVIKSQGNGPDRKQYLNKFYRKRTGARVVGWNQEARDRKKD
jgi:hypothetical protein